MGRWLLVLIAVSAVLGCDSSPYGPGDSAYGPTKPVVKQPDPIIKIIPPAIYTLDAPNMVVFTEGAAGTFQVAGSIQNDTAVLNIENLPKGATFDATTGTVTWTPALGDGHDPLDPRADRRIYPLYVDLRGASDTLTVRQKTVMVIVRAKLGTLSFANFPTSVDVYEGQNGSLKFQLADDIYPTGPFKVELQNMPPGMTLAPTSDPTVYTVNYSPGYKTALSSDPYCTNSRADACRKVTFDVYATDPAGTQISYTGSWQVHNQTQAPRVEAPTSVQANGSTATFSIYVEDVNGENAPSVSADVDSGRVNVSTITGGTNSAGNPDGLFQLTVTRSGTHHYSTVTIKSCITDKQNNDACTTNSVDVSF